MNKLLKKTQILQKSNKWYEIRNTIITSTDVSTILESNKYQSKRQLLLNKISNKISQSNESVEWGNFFEDIAFNIYSNKYNIKIHNLGLILHDKYKFLGASPDGLLENNILLEIKCPYSQKIFNEIPINYWIQTQIQMEVCNINKTVLFVCAFKKDTINNCGIFGTKDNTNWSLLESKEFIINRDKKWFNKILPRLNIFYNDLNYFKKNGFTLKHKLVNTRSNEYNKKIKLDYIDWNDWIYIYDLKNYFNNDPFLDWMNMYGKKYYSKEKDSVSGSFISNKSTSFKKKIIEFLILNYPDECKIITLNPKDNLKSNNSFQETIENIKKYPIVINGIINNKYYKIYGYIDLIINKTYMNKIFGIEIKEDYCLIKIEYSTLKFVNDNITIENNNFLNRYMYIIHNSLKEYNIITKCSIIGYKNKFSNNCLEKIGFINIQSDKINEAIVWIKNLKENGSQWTLNPPSVPELYPNMKNNKNYQWNQNKQIIAKEIEEITLLPGISYKKRLEFHNKSIYKISDIPNNKIANINNNFNKLIQPDKINSNINNWKNSKNILFIDFETVNDLNQNLDNFPIYEDNSLIYMIGVGYYNSISWKYYNFTVNKLNYKSEKEILTEFNKFLNRTNFDIIVHWSNAEINFLNKANKRHNLNICLKNNIDLMKLFKNEPILIKGLYSYKLKDVVKIMNLHNFININWDTINNALEAMILTWELNDYAIKNNIKLYNTSKFNSIIKYNEIDCKVMYEIMNYLKKNHI